MKKFSGTRKEDKKHSIPRRWALTAAVLAAGILASGCPPYPYSNPYDQNWESRDPFNIPEADITVDGSPAEWADLFLTVIPDPEGDAEGGDPAVDLKAVYAAQDSDYLYCMLEFWESVNSTPERDVEYQFSINYRNEAGDYIGSYNGRVSYDSFDSKWNGEITDSLWGSEDNPGENTLLHEGADLFAIGEVVEMRIPLTVYGEIEGVTFAYVDVGREVYNPAEETYYWYHDNAGFDIMF
jgi:hypothetical protein